MGVRRPRNEQIHMLMDMFRFSLHRVSRVILGIRFSAE
jgi:hypothetical protein